MVKSSQNSTVTFDRPCVVGIVHSSASLATAQRLRAGDLDFIELRVDAFADEPDLLLRAAEKLRIPLIVTVRHASEGGAGPLSAARRRELFAAFLPLATAIDIELSTILEMSPALAAARAHQVRVILSHHDFQQTPPAKKMRELASHAARARADIFKIATVANSPRDLVALLDFLASPSPLPRSVMGMGELGKISRLLFAASGSVLNYGFLDTANASGQWPAKLLQTRIAEVCPPAIPKANSTKNGR